MAGKSHLSMRAAAMSGFARCSESTAPLCCLSEFLDSLSAIGWEPRDVRDVEKSVLELLGQAKEDALERQQNSDTA